MKAILITDQKEPIQLRDIEKPEMGPDDCLVKIKAAALNRRDQWMREGLYPGIQFDTVLGSDGCGVVEEGPKEWLGKEVIINPNIQWGDDPKVQSRDYNILGMPVNGTFSEYLKIPADRLHEKPGHCDFQSAAAIPLAGLTAYRATIKKAKVDKGRRILVTGIGGGVAQFALQFAVAVGARVDITTSQDLKGEKAKAMGAEHTFHYTDDDWVRKAALTGGYDAIIDGSGGDFINKYLKITKPGGKMVLYGSTAGYPKKFDVFRLFWSQVQVEGSTMGNDEEFAEMLNFVNAHSIAPQLDKVFTLDTYLEAFDQFRAPGHFGKIILDMEA